MVSGVPPEADSGVSALAVTGYWHLAIHWQLASGCWPLAKPIRRHSKKASDQQQGASGKEPEASSQGPDTRNLKPTYS